MYKILCFGDSLTEGYTKYGTKYHPYTWKLQEKFDDDGHNVQVINFGKSGERTDAMVPRFFDLVNKNNFDAIVILGGTNDLSVRAATSIFGNLKKMLDCAAEKGIAAFAVTIPELAFEKHSFSTRFTRHEVNSSLKTYCEDNSIPLIDLASLIPYHTLPENERHEIWDDGCHFTEKGYDLFGEIVYAVLLGMFS